MLSLFAKKKSTTEQILDACTGSAMKWAGKKVIKTIVKTPKAGPLVMVDILAKGVELGTGSKKYGKVASLIGHTVSGVPMGPAGMLGGALLWGLTESIDVLR